MPLFDDLWNTGTSGSGSSGGGSSSSGGGGYWSSSSNWLDWLNFGLQGYSAYSNQSNQKKANETNVALSRENMAWQERMSNTAVQRRKADIEKAGGNPALAFTNGAEASTPSVQSARVEPPRFDAPKINTAMALARAQLDNIQAQTHNTSADTRIKNTQGRILEEYGGANSAAELKGKENQLSLFDAQVRKATADADISETTAQLMRSQKEAAIRLITAQARMGEMNADSAESITKMLGVTGKDASSVTKIILEIARSLIIGGRQ